MNISVNKSKAVFCFLFAFLTITFGSCTEKLEMPEVVFSASPNPANVNEAVTITFDGTFDKISIWTGDQGHNYDQYLQLLANPDPTVGRNKPYDNQGVPLTEKSFTYKYPSEGEYTIVVIATSISRFGDETKRVVVSEQISIK